MDITTWMLENQILLAWIIVSSAIAYVIIYFVWDYIKRKKWKVLGYVRVIDLNINKIWLSKLYYDNKNDSYYLKRRFRKILIPKPNSDTVILYQKNVKDLDLSTLDTKDISIDYEKLIKRRMMSGFQGVFFTHFLLYGIIIGIAVGIFAGIVIAPFIFQHYPIFPQPPINTTTTTTTKPPITITKIIEWWIK
jgi:hypothetical protein